MISALGSLAMGLVGGYAGWELVRYMAVMLCGITASMLLGAAVGIVSKNQMTSVAAVMPVALVAGFMPMLAMFNDKFEAVSRILYTQQINYMIADISPANMCPTRFLVIGANMLVFLAIFAVAYKRGNLSRD